VGKIKIENRQIIATFTTNTSVLLISDFLLSDVENTEEKRESANFIARKAVFFFLGEGVREGFPRECTKVYYESNYDFSRLLYIVWNHPEAEKLN
jgi:hypothetical protein